MAIVLGSVVVCATLGALIASSKGISPFVGVLFGGLFSILGLLFLAVMHRVEPKTDAAP